MEIQKGKKRWKRSRSTKKKNEKKKRINYTWVFNKIF